MLATDFQSFEKGDQSMFPHREAELSFSPGEMFRDTMHSVLGVGVFNADGEMWKYALRAPLHVLKPHNCFMQVPSRNDAPILQSRPYLALRRV